MRAAGRGAISNDTGMIAVKQRTLGSGPGISNFLFRFYTICVALLGATLAYRGGALVAAGGSPYYAMMGTALLLSAILIGLKKSLGIYLFGAASLATYGWAIWESGYDGWAFSAFCFWLFGPWCVVTLPMLKEVTTSPSWVYCRYSWHSPSWCLCSSRPLFTLPTQRSQRRVPNNPSVVIRWPRQTGILPRHTTKPTGPPMQVPTWAITIPPHRKLPLRMCRAW